MSHHPLAVVAPVSTFIMEVLPWAASGAIGLYLLWVACLAPAPERAPTAPAQGPAAISRSAPEAPGPAARRAAWGIAALPGIATADRPVTDAM